MFLCDTKPVLQLKFRYLNLIVLSFMEFVVKKCFPYECNLQVRIVVTKNIFTLQARLRIDHLRLIKRRCTFHGCLSYLRCNYHFLGILHTIVTHCYDSFCTWIFISIDIKSFNRVHKQSSLFTYQLGMRLAFVHFQSKQRQRRVKTKLLI